MGQVSDNSRPPNLLISNLQGGGFGGQGRGAEDNPGQRDAEDLYIDGEPAEVVANILRDQYTWRQAFHQAPLGFRVHGAPTTTCDQIAYRIARRLHLRRTLVVFHDEDGRLVHPQQQLGEGAVWTLLTRAAAAQAAWPAEDLQGEHQPQQAPPWAAPQDADQPAAVHDGAGPAEHQGHIDLRAEDPLPVPHPRPSQAPELDQAPPPDRHSRSRSRSPHRQRPLNIVLRMPTIYRQPPARPREVFRLPVRGAPAIEVEVEEGTHAADYNDTLAIVDPYHRNLRRVDDELLPGDMVAWEGDIIIDVAYIRGGGRGREPGEQPHTESQTYQSALARLTSMEPPVAPKVQIKAVLRAVPKLPRKVLRATTEGDARLAITAAAATIGIQWKQHAAPHSPKSPEGKGRGASIAQQTQDQEKKEKPSYLQAARSNSKGVARKPKIGL